jgi:hypothetical protein
MTTRESLKAQALKVLLDADEAHAPEGPMWPELAEALIDAGWRPPPSGDVGARAEQGGRILFDHLATGSPVTDWQEIEDWRREAFQRAASALFAWWWVVTQSSGGDVIEQTQNELRHRIEDLGLVQEIEGEDGGEIYDGPRVYEEAAAILTRNLAEEGLLAYSKAEVPEADDETVERVARAIMDAYAAACDVPPDFGDVGSVEDWHPEAHAALRAIGKAGTDGTP